MSRSWGRLPSRWRRLWAAWNPLVTPRHTLGVLLPAGPAWTGPGANWDQATCGDQRVPVLRKDHPGPLLFAWWDWEEVKAAGVQLTGRLWMGNGTRPGLGLLPPLPPLARLLLSISPHLLLPFTHLLVPSIPPYSYTDQPCVPPCILPRTSFPQAAQG